MQGCLRPAGMRSANSRQLPDATDGGERPVDQGAWWRLGCGADSVIPGIGSKNSAERKSEGSLGSVQRR